MISCEAETTDRRYFFGFWGWNDSVMGNGMSGW